MLLRQQSPQEQRACWVGICVHVQPDIVNSLLCNLMLISCSGNEKEDIVTMNSIPIITMCGSRRNAKPTKEF